MRLLATGESHQVFKSLYIDKDNSLDTRWDFPGGCTLHACYEPMWLINQHMVKFTDFGLYTMTKCWRVLA